MPGNIKALKDDKKNFEIFIQGNKKKIIITTIVTTKEIPRKHKICETNNRTIEEDRKPDHVNT